VKHLSPSSQHHCDVQDDRQTPHCHSERSEESRSPSSQTLAEFTLSKANVLNMPGARTQGINPRYSFQGT
jgi:hypothetical protein